MWHDLLSVHVCRRLSGACNPLQSDVTLVSRPQAPTSSRCRRCDTMLCATRSPRAWPGDYAGASRTGCFSRRCRIRSRRSAGSRRGARCSRGIRSGTARTDFDMAVAKSWDKWSLSADWDQRSVGLSQQGGMSDRRGYITSRVMYRARGAGGRGFGTRASF